MRNVEREEGKGAALGLGDVAAQQVAALGVEGPGAVLLTHLALRIQRRHQGSFLPCACAAGREYQEEDDGNVLVHGSPFGFDGRAAPELRDSTSTYPADLSRGIVAPKAFFFLAVIRTRAGSARRADGRYDSTCVAPAPSEIVESP